MARSLKAATDPAAFAADPAALTISLTVLSASSAAVATIDAETDFLGREIKSNTICCPLVTSALTESGVMLENEIRAQKNAVILCIRHIFQQS